jgi:hypothetical protein
MASYLVGIIRPLSVPCNLDPKHVGIGFNTAGALVRYTFIDMSWIKG